MLAQLGIDKRVHVSNLLWQVESRIREGDEGAASIVDPSLFNKMPTHKAPGGDGGDVSDDEKGNGGGAKAKKGDKKAEGAEGKEADGDGDGGDDDEEEDDDEGFGGEADLLSLHEVDETYVAPPAAGAPGGAAPPGGGGLHKMCTFCNQ